MAGHVVCFAMAPANGASSAQETVGKTVSRVRVRRSVQTRDTIRDAAAGLLGGQRNVLCSVPDNWDLFAYARQGDAGPAAGCEPV
jgi:hypothetical protein